MWIALHEAVAQRLTPAPTPHSLVRRIQRHNQALPPGHPARIRHSRGAVVAEDLKHLACNRK